MLWTNLYVGGNDNERRKCSLSREKMGTGNKTTLDLDDLNAGADYTDLKTSYIIFICISDIFEKGLPCYSFENLCREDISVHLNDRAYKYFFIAQNCDKILNEKQKSFLQLVLGQKASDNFTKRIEELTEEAKHNTQWRQQYMEWERQRTYDFENGKEAKAIEAAINLLKMKVGTPEQIAQAQGLPLEKVLELQKQIPAKA